MRMVFLVVAGLALGLPAAAQSDEFMKECMVTASQKMCECIAGRIPA
jgi:hypothetical protein